MGEKIRDIKSIKIGKSSLMVELNEGYSASQGRLIHIQNKKFRYLLTLEDFYHLSTMVMRAWSEFDYLKHKEPDYKLESDFEDTPSIETDYSLLSEIDLMLRCQDTAYRVVDCFNGTITLLINPEHIRNAEETLNLAGAKRVAHPFGIENGFKFLYQMHPFSMYRYRDTLIELFCQLPCRSITKNTWIPLDRMIQGNVWASHDDIQGIPWCDKVSRYIYLLCYAIFVDKGFSPHIKRTLSSISEILTYDRIEEYFSVVFFNFTNTIITLLLNEDYDRIIPQYHSFNEY